VGTTLLTKGNATLAIFSANNDEMVDGKELTDEENDDDLPRIPTFWTEGSGESSAFADLVHYVQCKYWQGS
jgi:hypothetical protein